MPCHRDESIGQLTIPALVLAEASYLIGVTLGASAETALLRSVTTTRFEVIGPTQDDLVRMASLAATYEDLPLGATDASIVALAERLTDPRLATCPKHGRLEILGEGWEASKLADDQRRAQFGAVLRWTSSRLEVLGTIKKVNHSASGEDQVAGWSPRNR